MSEMKSITLNGKKYDSFVDQTARMAIEHLEQTMPDSSANLELVRTAVEDYFTENPIELPEDGGYYIPQVSISGDALCFSFQASNANMPGLPPQIVTLPQPDLSGYVRTINGESPDENGNVVIAVTECTGMVTTSPDGTKWRLTVGNDGTVSAVKVGDSTEIPAVSIALSANVLLFANSASRSLTATVEPADSTDAVVWTSSDSTVANVSSTGIVTPVSNGHCTITATAGNASASCEITVSIESGNITTYSITRNLTNVMHFDDSTTIGQGSELLECYVSNDECTMDGAAATITMGGEDITSTAWDNGVVNISEVNGDVVISVDAVQIQYVVPPVEDFEIQVHEGSLLLKKYIGTEKAIQTPTSLTYNDKEYTMTNGTLKLYALDLEGVEHFKDVGLPYFQSRYSNIAPNIKTILPQGEFITVRNAAYLEKVPVYQAANLPAFTVTDIRNLSGSAIRTAQQVEYPNEQTNLAYLYMDCRHLIDGGTIPAHITNIANIFYNSTNLRRVRIEGRSFDNILQWAAGVQQLELTCYPDSTLFASLRYQPNIDWSFKDIDGQAINRILCFGDSLSERTYEQALCDLCPATAMVNALGNGGYTSDQIYQKIVDGTYDKLLKEGIAVIWHGTNGYGEDGYDGVTAKMVAALNGNQRYLLIPPTAQGAGDEVYESWVATYGAEHVLSMGDWFENNGYTISDYQFDGCHFTADGYALVAQAIYEKIQHWL